MMNVHCKTVFNKTDVYDESLWSIVGCYVHPSCSKDITCLSTFLPPTRMERMKVCHWCK